MVKQAVESYFWKSPWETGFWFNVRKKTIMQTLIANWFTVRKKTIMQTLIANWYTVWKKTIMQTPIANYCSEEYSESCKIS